MEQSRIRPSARYAILLFTLLALSRTGAASPMNVLDDAFSCKVKVKGKDYDLTPLDKVYEIEDYRQTPPTQSRTTVYVSLCSPIPTKEDAPKEDQCPEGARLCMVTENLKEGKEDRVVSVIPVAGQDSDNKLKPQTATEKNSSFVLNLHGGSYLDVSQSATILFHCDLEAEESSPTLTNYDASKGLLSLSWTAREGCDLDTIKRGNKGGSGGDGGDKESGEGKNDDDKEKDEDEKSSSEGGMGFFAWLFLLIFIGFFLYFGIGIWNNYSRFGSTGWDLIPHQEFWRDLPYVIKDLIFRSTGGNRRAGYSTLG